MASAELEPMPHDWERALAIVAGSPYPTDAVEVADTFELIGR
jgi:hypothetical protein